jgi:hypothetical protein
MSNGQKQCTVGELIEALQKRDPEELVWTEGCDCIGEASLPLEDTNYTDKVGVMIGRSN